MTHDDIKDLNAAKQIHQNDSGRFTPKPEAISTAAADAPFPLWTYFRRGASPGGKKNVPVIK